MKDKIKETILQIKGLYYSYTNEKDTLNNINIDIYKGEKMAVLGSNGAGKSTFFLNINGVLKPKSGEIIYKGKMITKKDLNELRKNGYDCYYWESDGKAEIDFIIQKNAEIIPIEVKTSIHTKSRSLDLYMKKYEPKYSIRISEKNFGIENNIKSVPLYAVFCI